MPTAADYQSLHDKLREPGTVIVQALNLGDQELGFWTVGPFGERSSEARIGRERLPPTMPPPLLLSVGAA